MKSLFVALICFALLVWGLYDVKSFKTTLKKATRRSGNAQAKSPERAVVPDQPTGDPRYFDYEPQASRRYR
jgi:hypothetical protein